MQLAVNVINRQNFSVQWPLQLKCKNKNGKTTKWMGTKFELEFEFILREY